MKFGKVLTSALVLGFLATGNEGRNPINHISVEAAQGSQTGVTTARLNMRTGAGTNHALIRTLPLGQNVTILRQSGAWMQVRVGNQEGWVHSDWVRVTNNNDNNNATATRTGVTTARLNMRTGAGTNHALIRTLPLGQNITILRQSGAWMQVRVGNQEGWVHSDWVRVTNNNDNNNNDNNNDATVTRTGVTTARLNMRAGAGTNHALIRTLPLGQNVTILRQNGAWMQVRVGNQEGWVHSDWVRVTNNNDNNNNDTTVTQAGITTARLNMRVGAGTHYALIRTLPLGQNVTITRQNGAWMQVRVGNQEGWVHSDWVRITNHAGGGSDQTGWLPIPGFVNRIDRTENIVHQASGKTLTIPTERTINLGSAFDFQEGIVLRNANGENITAGANITFRPTNPSQPMDNLRPGVYSLTATVSVGNETLFTVVVQITVVAA